MIESNKTLHYFYKYIPVVFVLMLVLSLFKFDEVNEFQIYFVSFFSSIMILLQIVFIKKFGLAKLDSNSLKIFGKSFSWAEIKTVKRFNHIYILKTKQSSKYYFL
ncbi:MAG: hypothetical protein UZ12_BCD005000005 [Bacteroidetes bacterium OLB12]|nr:MAG: hypothetical protein UZ12_BCD005000005 [Bacteroidetes bacterium OLB12]